ILQRLTNALAAGNFAHARVAGIVLEDDDVASEKRSVRTAQVQEHAVMTGHRDDQHLSHDRRLPRDALRHETLPAYSARRKIGRPMVGMFPVCCAPAARSAHERDELPTIAHSITSSAVASGVGGTSRPSALQSQTATLRTTLPSVSPFSTYSCADQTSWKSNTLLILGLTLPASIKLRISRSSSPFSWTV